MLERSSKVKSIAAPTETRADTLGRRVVRSNSETGPLGMPGSRRRYRFVINESFTPETLPMWRLAEYMADMASLLGEKASVHFVRLDEGSTSLVQDVEHEAYPKVRARVHDVKHGDGPQEARKAFDNLNRKLAEDNATGELIEDPTPETPLAQPAKILLFPGKRRFVELEYGPFTEAGELQGQVIVVGGESDPVPIHLRDIETVHICRAKLAVSKELAAHYLGPTIRVTGNGRWLRDAEGQWQMKGFNITAFSVLKDDSLSSVIAKLRQVPGKWKEQRTQLASLEQIRVNEG